MKLLSFLPMHKIMRVAKIPTNVWLEPKNEVSIRSTPYCISQKNIVPLHGGIIFLILRQEYAI